MDFATAITHSPPLEPLFIESLPLEWLLFGPLCEYLALKDLGSKILWEGLQTCRHKLHLCYNFHLKKVLVLLPSSFSSHSLQPHEIRMQKPEYGWHRSWPYLQLPSTPLITTYSKTLRELKSKTSWWAKDFPPLCQKQKKAIRMILGLEHSFYERPTLPFLT